MAIGKPTRLDLAGQSFGRLTVIHYVGLNQHGKPLWLCRCTCGVEKHVAAPGLQSGRTRSCGCLRREVGHARMFQDLSGQRFGRLQVLGYAGKKACGEQQLTLWHCRCDCGTAFDCRAGALKNGNTRSCGCTHYKHGMARRREYFLWFGMIGRCHDPKARGYKRYGAKGISVCDRWRSSFIAFHEDMGPCPSLRHSLDRYPNQCGNYEPGNCRWATTREQARNRTTNHCLTFRAQTLSLAEWSEQTGVKADTILHRLYRGWSVERALTQSPSHHLRPNPAAAPR